MSRKIITTPLQKLLLIILGIVFFCIITETGLQFAGMFITRKNTQNISHDTVVCIGDSFTYGIGSAAAESYPSFLQKHLRDHNINVINLGRPGANSAEIIDVFQKYLEQHPYPKYVVFLGGINDLWNRRTSVFSSQQSFFDTVIRNIKKLKIYTLFSLIFYNMNAEPLQPIVNVQPQPASDNIQYENVLLTTAASVEQHIFTVPFAARSKFEKYMFMKKTGRFKKASFVLYDILSTAENSIGIKYHHFRNSFADLNYFKQLIELIRGLFGWNPHTLIPYLCRDILRQHDLDYIPKLPNDLYVQRQTAAFQCIQSIRMNSRNKVEELKAFIQRYPYDIRAEIFQQIIDENILYEDIKYALIPELENYLYFLKKADEYVQKNDAARAIQYLEIALILHPFDVNSYIMLAEIYREHIDVAKAQHIIECAEKLGGNSTELVIQKSIILQMNGEYHRAQQLLKPIYYADKQNTTLAVQYTKLLIMNNKYDEAYRILTALYEIYPQNIDVYTALLTVCAHYGRSDEFHELLRSIHHIDQDQQQYVRFIQVMINLKRYAELRKIFHLSEHSSDDEIVLMNTFLKDTGRFIEQQKLLEKWTVIRPQSPAIQKLYIEHLISSAQYIEAQTRIERFRNISNDHTAADLLQAELFVHKNDPHAALDIIEHLPEDVNTMLVKVKAYVQLDHPESIAAFSELTDRYGSYNETIRFLYEYSSASPPKHIQNHLIQCVERNIQRYPSQHDHKYIKAALLSHHHTETAKSIILQTSGFEKDHFALKLLIHLLLIQGKYDEAIQYMVKDHAIHENLRLSLNSVSPQFKEFNKRVYVIREFLKKVKAGHVSIDESLYSEDHIESVYNNALLRLKKIVGQSSTHILALSYPNALEINNTLHAVSNTHNIDTISLYEAFVQRVSKEKYPEYFVIDGHCNNRGYKVIADIVYDHMKKNEQ